MSAATNKPGKPDGKITFSEILFGTLLAVGAVSCIWISSTLLIHLYSSMY